jgi:arginine/ornithine N-succinyltransferase beta subunit
MLVARPVERADLESLLEISRYVNVASMRAERAKNELTIEQSIRTLAGALAWQQGLMMLAADIHTEVDEPAELAGQIKLQVGWGGYWQKKSHDRLFNLPGLATWAQHAYLTYQPNPEDEFALELAGLAVMPKHRGKNVARLLTQAWASFVLLHEQELRRRIGTITYLCANVLTADAAGKYPFYEQVVKPLFGGLDYDTVDAHRYARSNARSPILDEFLDARGDQPRASILCHLLSDDLRQDLGKVRDQSIGCQKNLERLGFTRTDKFDVLDGGQYFESTLARLDKATPRRTLAVRPVPEWELRTDAALLTLSLAGRSMSEFRCIQTRGEIQADEVRLGRATCATLGLEADASAVVLLDQTPCHRPQIP